MSTMNSKEHTNTNVDATRVEESTPPGQCEVQFLPIDLIRVAECCRRSNYRKDLDLLRDSIRKRGLIQNPVVIDDGKGGYVLIAGSRRFLACKSLGYKTMPCNIRRMDKKEAPFIAFSENAVRTKPDPVDEARFLRKMKDITKMTDEQLAAEVGLPQSGVTERLSILDLPEDVLARIDGRPESPFRLTHAVGLSQLARSNRFNRAMEVRELLGKTIEHTLSSSELKSLVQLLKSGEYDRLPEKLRMLLLKSRHMTSAMAQLFLYPEKWVEGDSTASEVLRKRASQLDSARRERFVEDAVSNNLPEQETKKRLRRLLEAADSRTTEKEGGDSSVSAVEDITSDITSLLQKFQIHQHDLASMSGSNPTEFIVLRKLCERLIRVVGSFLNSITGTTGQ